ncbi:hypothetical protein HB847_04035 [Listeria booriae]|uniref:Polysaccharide chain length determinant N-terminal domain-containing protein n=1 Tax=Listeria booriae TaxID=1552123 RepID=A0A841XW53_9LIST|nr:Wzz/FepE/Etk N-terminal domain-containing protein [Listeria booriae]MBC1371529.1 hypothetical protein [Listeria booriae]
MNKSPIDIADVFKIIKSYAIMLVLIPIIACISAFVASKYLLTPIYTASSQIFIATQAPKEGQTSVYSEQLKSNVQLINTFNMILKNARTIEKVKKELDITTPTPELAKALQIQSEKDSLVFTVSFKDENPERATKVVNAVTQAYQQDIPQLIESNKVIILEKASVPTVPSSPKLVINLIIAGIIGIIMDIIFVLTILLFRNTINSEKDLEDLNLNSMGTIPLIKSKG